VIFLALFFTLASLAIVGSIAALLFLSVL
jgi:hypothetical protein